MIKLKHLLPECEDCTRDWNHGHDHEASMAKNELRDMISNASKIDSLVKDGDNLPGWISAYISLAADYMHSAVEYLAGESMRNQQPGPGYGTMNEGIELGKVEQAETSIRMMMKNISTNSNIPTQEKVGLLRALEELLGFVDEVGYESEMESNPNEAKDPKGAVNKKESGEKFIKCRNCKKLFTQTIHKGKKSLPICPTCKTHN